MKTRTWMWSTAMCLFAALAITVQTSAQSQMIASATTKTSFKITGSAAGVTYGRYDDCSSTTLSILGTDTLTKIAPGAPTEANAVQVT